MFDNLVKVTQPQRKQTQKQVIRLGSEILRRIERPHLIDMKIQKNGCTRLKGVFVEVDTPIFHYFIKRMHLGEQIAEDYS